MPPEPHSDAEVLRARNAALERSARGGPVREVTRQLAERRRLLEAMRPAARSREAFEALIDECAAGNRRCLEIMQGRLDFLRGKLESLVRQKTQLRSASARAAESAGGQVVRDVG
jgi:hypothetical protein